MDPVQALSPLSLMESRINGVSRHLSWALVIATFKRAHILPRCLKFAALQTAPPSEIIVVDASPDWAATRAAVMSDLASQHEGIRWIYVEAERPSSA